MNSALTALIDNAKFNRFHLRTLLLCALIIIFDGYDLISALHSFMSVVDIKYAKVLPPLKLLSTENQQKLLNQLKKLNFTPNRNNVV